MPHRIRAIVAAAVSAVALVLLAIVNRQSAFVDGFVGGSVQWLLTATIVVALVVSGAALGALWSEHSRLRIAAHVAPRAFAVSAAALVVFAQTYSPVGSAASGFIGLTAIASLLVAAAAAIVAAIGTGAPSRSQSQSR